MLRARQKELTADDSDFDERNSGDSWLPLRERSTMNGTKPSNQQENNQKIRVNLRYPR
jgi:hypothetical protein